MYRDGSRKSLYEYNPFTLRILPHNALTDEYIHCPTLIPGYPLGQKLWGNVLVEALEGSRWKGGI
jgi:hypothetical protein